MHKSVNHGKGYESKEDIQYKEGHSKDTGNPEGFPLIKDGQLDYQIVV